MYNTAGVKYDTVEEYQQAILTAFNQTEYTDDLPELMFIVCKRYNLVAPDMPGIPDDVRYMLLFSYEQFAETHSTLCRLIAATEPGTV
jgi:hypothetical protein